MRVLQVSNFAEPLGGAEVHMHQVIEALGARGHRVALFAGSEQTEEHTELRRVVKRPAWSPADLIHDPKLLTAFESFLEEFKPELIHLHNASHLPISLITTLGSHAAPVLMTVHDASVVCANAWLVWGDGTPCPGGVGAKCLSNGCEKNYPFDARVLVASRLRTEALQSNVDAFASPSRFLLERISEDGFENVHHLPYWIEKSPRPEGIERDHDQVLFLGRLAREKGLDVLLRAWARVQQARPQARLTIVGSGPEEQDLRSLAAELGLDVEAIFVGRVPHDQVAEVQARAAIQVIPSIWGENSPVSIYESYLAGLPMVASSIGGIPEMVREGETGLLARPRDPEHLAQRLVELLSDRELQKRLAAGCLASVEQFTPEVHMDQLLPLYEGLLRNGQVDTARRPPIAADHIQLQDAIFRQLHETESWAQDMLGHIKNLEGDLPPGTPIKNFARHVKHLVKRRLPRAR